MVGSALWGEGVWMSLCVGGGGNGGVVVMMDALWW